MSTKKVSYPNFSGTLEAHLMRLPEGYRQRAFVNAAESPRIREFESFAAFLSQVCFSVSGAVRLAFAWKDSPEGEKFWNRVHDACHWFPGESYELPPLPDTTQIAIAAGLNTLRQLRIIEVLAERGPQTLVELMEGGAGKSHEGVRTLLLRMKKLVASEAGPRGRGDNHKPRSIFRLSPAGKELAEKLGLPLKADT